METKKFGQFNIVILSILGLLILTISLVEVILCFTPPIARDALIHHLAIPKLWLENGGFYETPWAVYSYYPMNIDLLYLIPLYFKNDIIPNLIHMSFGLGTALLIYLYLHNISGRTAGLLGVLIFISTPIIIRMSTVAYVDLSLTFFTTASLFSFVRWRNGNYSNNTWLLVASVTMGLALGTKYNALIAWFFLSLAIVFVYSRDTKEQVKAISYGILFFLVSFLVFSPWLIKNIILTGNPLYPLFQGILNSGGASSSPSLVSGESSMGIFKTREILYQESFWETLLVPVRFFFQGQDHSDRFFDGVLNPLLIVFIPFAFIFKSEYRNKVLFLLFACFYILTSFFLDQLRIRYFLPAVPLLAVLTVIGLINIFNWAGGKPKIIKYLIFTATLCFLTVMIGNNFLYMKNYFQTIQPINYVFGSETREHYISSHVKSYKAISFINKNTPPQSRIKLILLAGRGYYLDRIYEEDASMGMDIIRRMVEKSGDDRSFYSLLNDLGCTHLLINMNLFRQFLQNNYHHEDAARLLRQMNKTMEKVYDADGYAVYKLIHRE